MSVGRITRKLAALPGRLWRFSKRLYQPIRYRPHYPETLLFIMGCQRSGTGLMGRILRNDPDSIVFGEFTALNSLDTAAGIRLDPPDRLREYLSRLRAPLVVVKPLVESQNARALLDKMDNLRIVWIYRDYRDVVASNLKKFGRANGIDDIRPLVTGDQANWRAENVPEHIRATVRQHFSEDMSQEDAAALFWFVRNSLYFEQGLNENKDVLLVAYRDLVQNPDMVVRRIYGFLGLEFPGAYLFREVHSTSLGKGASVAISPEVESLCHSLLDRLEAEHRRTSALAGN